jgi:hypothetical protein
MNVTDKDEIIKRMMSGSDVIRKNRNKSMRAYRRKNKDGKLSKSHKIKLGKYLKKLEIEDKIYE